VARTSRRSKRTGAAPLDEPSTQWGWHGSFPNATRIAGVVSAIVLVLLMIGPYQSRLQDFWIVGIVVAILALIVRGTLKRRNAWRQ
jgi:lysylphosphatidylglycerol synthetase-like protein (DUF2156 family)